MRPFQLDVGLLAAQRSDVTAPTPAAVLISPKKIECRTHSVTEYKHFNQVTQNHTEIHFVKMCQ